MDKVDYAHYAELVLTNAKVGNDISEPWGQRTRKNRENRLMDGLDLPRMEDVAREEGDYEQDD
ncbi:hypothetical protein PtrSN002B_007208 [Pyrenophora tritici-repentis]|uniref:Uncharacterized protein n=1 Tax=Pyrenophora tritici-repentis TaxID=45151 RepID=A0A2W1E4H4_9PLEO|nr:Sodium/hydrogen exchanger [Pyrenophora tritici-repentis]KAF7577457.1 hypothetical protein PtrM4_016970 [Pyrenophora tritici-repentis]KAI1534821.1 hypothetical protein PtrSN001A_006255 [Pyrenophora tritici-repentis]KAI1540041.1 hypothetical protein PtrSN001C_005090 [Pyrenophora tritici-repentis]KAI1545615.1 hypothetical protein PtrSN002B_007208 [Pyrenophora tritici-repentis]